VVGETLWAESADDGTEAPTETVLIVEDESIVALDIKMHLETYGYTVPEPVSTGEDALACVAQSVPSLVIMDIKLQGELDGLETAERIRAEHNLPIIMLTAHADEATLHRALGSQPSAYIIKPFEERELRTTVAVTLARHRMERAIADREKLLETTLNSIGEGVVVTDNDGTVSFANPVALAVVRARQEDVVGAPFAASFRFRRTADDSEADGLPGSEEVGVRDELVAENDEAVPVERTVTPLLDDAGTRVGTVWVFRDVSQRVASEAALEESREQLRRAQKMEAIGRLSGGIAHDFNNLLTAILGYTKLVDQILEGDGEVDLEAVRKDVAGIESVAQRSVALTRQLLTFSRRQYAEPQVLDLNAVVGNLDGMIRRLLSEDVQLRVSLTADPSIVWADRGQLEQVILNLTVNARDAMPEGGVLSVTTQTVHESGARSLRAGRVDSGDYVMLEVADTGVGIADEDMDRLFEPFFTTKQEDSGTGLGLATVYGIVHQLGGGLDVESDPRSGSIFRVYVPLNHGSPDDMQHATEVEEAYTGSETILLVERDSHVLSVLTRALRGAGYQVIGVANPGEAILVVEEGETPVQLLVTDAVMPHIDGLRLAERVNRNQPGLKVVLLSGYPEQLPDELPDTLHVEFLQKPFEPRNFLRRVRALLDG
jgi:PAS domain S-box-containing protein